MTPKPKFEKGDTVTNLFDYGVVLSSEYSDGDGFDYPGWWYRVQVDGEKYWVWMYEPDMVHISEVE